MNLPVRLASLEDRLAVEIVVRAAYAPYVSRLGWKPAPLIDDYRKLIEEGRVYVVDYAGSIHGVLAFVFQLDVLLLENVAVSPTAQGLGLGRAMLEFAEQTARAAGCRSIELYTNELMIENRKLYTRIGYAETHRREEHGLRRVYMAKNLRDSR